jgi:hypothetical protein
VFHIKCELSFYIIFTRNSVFKELILVIIKASVSTAYNVLYNTALFYKFVVMNGRNSLHCDLRAESLNSLTRKVLHC